MADTPVLAFISCGDADEARAIARMLVQRRLAAAANVIGGVTSMFRWDGAVQERGEALVIAKTRAARSEAIVQAVTAEHGYEMPGVAFAPIDGGHKPYLAWILSETDVQD